ncbi:MAG: hypothetical protein IPJ22_13425 [Bacteroidetes bacterium]|nr:hypothetical protein [Bacteroidota bacterium]
MQLFSFKNPNVVVNEISCESIYNYFYDDWGGLFRIGFAEKDGYDPV